MYEKINKASYIKHQKKNFDSLKNIAELFLQYIKDYLEGVFIKKDESF